MNDLYRVPCDLSSAAVRAELAATHPAIEARSYVANGARNHSFTCKKTFRRVFFAETAGCPFAEVVGDVALWLGVRAVAAGVAGRRRAASAGKGETVELAA